MYCKTSTDYLYYSFLNYYFYIIISSQIYNLRLVPDMCVISVYGLSILGLLKIPNSQTK